MIAAFQWGKLITLHEEAGIFNWHRKEHTNFIAKNYFSLKFERKIIQEKGNPQFRISLHTVSGYGSLICSHLLPEEVSGGNWMRH